MIALNLNWILVWWNNKLSLNKESTNEKGKQDHEMLSINYKRFDYRLEIWMFVLSAYGLKNLFN